MRYFYIDTENVGCKAWCRNIDILNGNDVVVLMHSLSSNLVDIKYVPLIRNAKCKIFVVEVKTGTKNAMDFVLVSELSKRAASAKKSIHVIISNDKGYTPVIDYWNLQGVKVCQFDGINFVTYKSIKEMNRSAI